MQVEKKLMLGSSRKLWLIPVVALLVVAAAAIALHRPGTRSKTRQTQPREEAHAPVAADVGAANTAFGFDLLNQLADDNNDNVFISPASISIALAMTCNGANGDTRAAMANAMHLDGMDLDQVNEAYAAALTDLEQPGPGVKLSIANSLWLKDGFDFKNAYMQFNATYYHAELNSLAGGPKAINDWVSKQTQGKIRNLVQDLDSNTVLVLANAIYFKGTWQHKFGKLNTKSRPYHLPNRKTIVIPMMARTGEYRYSESKTLQVIELPYGRGRLSMIVCLPKKGSSLRGLRTRLSAERWTALRAGMAERQGEIILPRFTLQDEARDDLAEALKKLGMEIAFSESRADFSNMTDKRVWIDEVAHKTYIKVDEAGTEAAAATHVAAPTTAGPATRHSQPFKMIVDHPFLLAIVDTETGMMLFLGAINDPSQGAGS